MKKILASLCAASLVSSVAFADGGDQKDLKQVIADQGIYVETAQKGVTLSGYVDTSYTNQFVPAHLGGAGTTVGAPAFRQFDGNTGFNIDAVKIALEKALSDKNEYQAGFRVDAIAGQDAGILNTADPGLGSGGDSFYLEQAYVQFRAPIGNGIDFKFGKFVTLLGYEVIESPSNLNFSRGLLFTNAIPLTHTGALATYKINDTFTVVGGIVNGWNSSQSPVNDGKYGVSDVPAFTGQVTINNPGGNANITQSIIYSPGGESGVIGTGGNNSDVFTYDIWGNWSPKITGDKLLLGFNLDFGNQGDQSQNTGDISDTWWGAALYSKYQFTKIFSLAGRLEYFHDSNGVKIAAGPNSDLYSFTLTGGFNIWENLLTRVEYRVDTGDKQAYGSDKLNQEISLNLVYSF